MNVLWVNYVDNAIILKNYHFTQLDLNQLYVMTIIAEELMYVHRHIIMMTKDMIWMFKKYVIMLHIS